MVSIAKTLENRRGDFINSTTRDGAQTQQITFEMMTKLAPMIDQAIDNKIAKYTGIKTLHRYPKTEQADLQEVRDGLRDFVTNKGIHLITKGRFIKQTVIDENNPTIKALNTLAEKTQFNVAPLKTLLFQLLASNLPANTSLEEFNNFLKHEADFHFEHCEDSEIFDLDALLESFPSRPDHSVIQAFDTAFEFLNSIRKFSKVVDPAYA